MGYNPVRYWKNREQPTLLNEVDEDLANFIKMFTENADSILDVGCGEGRTFHLYPKVPVTGVDFVDTYHKEAIKEAEENELPFVHYQCNLNDALPFRNNVFSHGLAIKVLMHISNPKKAIDELARTCKYVFISDIWSEQEVAKHVFLHDYKKLLSGYQIRWWERMGDHLNIVYSK